MPLTNTIEILLAHNHWATRQLVDACGKLTEEQFHRRFQMGPGSLHDTLTHIVGAMRGWGDMLAGREARPRPEGTVKRTPAELNMMLDEAAAELVIAAADHPAEDLVTGTRGGKTHTFVRAGVLAHITTHGMHHRAQCLNMLRQLGVSPLPHSSVLEWMVMVDPVKPAGAG